eukprot:TRINITY_DN49354_c0_g1_i1.p1 TRINITY_DN49354_c0_g1~~TRINITY_DN49354_c0_g1_i1.p1  ORF type:complete len:290 (-),score=45.95 TRINITY_DN49354_c0_g1_i1:232-1101(-)
MGVCTSQEFYIGGPPATQAFADPNAEEDVDCVPPFKTFFTHDGVFVRPLGEFAPHPYFLFRFLCSRHEDAAQIVSPDIAVNVPHADGGSPRLFPAPFIEYRLALLDYVNRTIGAQRNVFFFAVHDVAAHLTRAYEPPGVATHRGLHEGMKVAYSAVVGDRALWRLWMHMRGGVHAAARTVPMDSTLRPPSIGVLEIVPRRRVPGRDVADSHIRLVGVSTSPIPTDGPAVIPRAGYFEESLGELSFAAVEADGCPPESSCDGTAAAPLVSALYAAFFGSQAFLHYRRVMA